METAARQASPKPIESQSPGYRFPREPVRAQPVEAAAVEPRGYQPEQHGDHHAGEGLVGMSRSVGFQSCEHLNRIFNVVKTSSRHAVLESVHSIVIVGFKKQATDKRHINF